MRYRRFTVLLFLALSIAFSATLFAATKRYQPLQFQVIGIKNAVILKNVTLALDNLRNRYPFPITQDHLQHFYSRAPRVIQQAIQPYGYFRSTITSTLTPSSVAHIAKFTVVLGPPLLITHMHIEIQGAGKYDRKLIALQKKLPLRVGGPLQTEQYELIKSELYNLATERGYFDAKMIKSQIQINLIRYHTNIIIIFNTGNRYRFGATHFSESPFHEKFLKRFLQYQEGHYYNAKELEKTKAGLIQSDYFNQVIIKPETKKAVNNVVPIDVDLITRRAKQYTLGLGYGTDTGVRGTVGVTLRHIGTQGHRFHTLLRASQNNSSLTAKYIIPGADPARDLFSIAGGLGNMQQSTGNGRNVKFGFAYSLSRGQWKNSLSLTYLNERYNFSNTPNISTELVYPRLDTKYFSADHPRHPTQGISVETQLSGASKAILSQTSFFQATLHLNTLYTIRKTNTRWLFHTELGHTNIATLFNLPLSLQFFAGGSHSMRGYGYNSIGPGRNMVVSGTEIQQRVIGDWYLAGFIDAGVVGNQNIFQHINAGAGPGVAWITTIGTLELTVGNAFTQSNHPWTYQFTMGTVL
ncbi:MAG: hypothetical protein A3C44_05075 [Gammaproteobacteria bacterium RIFCSPHIGHO2_02_FULL_39_13]|nr:MAG: hypothetical protein A3C44_05075 [Gammaproteobacteria bacterium RIFCSPHIGHO2_02_FULL_39_13]